MSKVESGNIKDLESLERFLDRVRGFHDGIVKELHWINRDHVEPALNMRVCQGSSARLLIQRQFEDPSAVELVLHDVARFKVDARDFVFGSWCELDLDGNLVLWCEACFFVCKSITYRFASDWMGIDARFGEAIEALP